MIDGAELRKLWPHAPDALIADISARAAAVFAKYDLSTPLRVVHFLAQISHESNGGTITEESLNYTHASRIAAVWPSRFTEASAQEFVGKPRELANKVYNDRMGNRPGSDDGWNYRGRGLLQITGSESYRIIGGLVGLDLVNNPGLVNAYDQTLSVAAAEFVNLKCLPACDADDVRRVTKLVNGGYIGLDSRIAWLGKWKSALAGQPSAPMPKPAPIPSQPVPVPPAVPQPSLIAQIINLILALFKRKS